MTIFNVKASQDRFEAEVIDRNNVNILTKSIVNIYGKDNFAPTSNSIADQYLPAGSVLDVSISGIFSDIDTDRNDKLVITAVSSDADICGASIINNTLRLTGHQNKGPVTITITATDLFGVSISTTVSVIVDITLWIIDHNTTRKAYHVRSNGSLINSFANHQDNPPPSPGTSGQGVTLRRSDKHVFTLQRSGERANHYDSFYVFIEQVNVFPLFQVAQNDIAYQDSNNTFWFCSGAADKVSNTDSTFTSILSQFTKDAFDSSAVSMEGIAFDDSDNTLWICDFNTDKIYNVSLTGTLINSFSSPDIRINGISVGDGDDLWVVHSGVPDIVYNITKGGVAISQFNTTTFEALNLNPRGIYVLDKI